MKSRGTRAEKNFQLPLSGSRLKGRSTS